MASDLFVAGYAMFMRRIGLAANTRYHRERTLARLAAWLPVPLAAASAADLAAWHAGLGHLSDQTVREMLCDARQFYGWLVRSGVRPDNPAAWLPSPRKLRRLPRPIARSDLFRALACAGPAERLILVLAAWCGLRACEIAGLRRECVLDTAQPAVILVAVTATKGSRERIVPLCPFAAGELAAWGLPAAGPVIPRRDGRPGPNTAHRISRIANDHLHAAGSPATLHQLRHWFGTESYRATRDLRLVQDLMGHADPATTAGYAAWDHAGAIAAVTALPVPLLAVAG